MAKEINIVPKELKPGSEEYKNATLEQLIGDAIARKDKEGLAFLKEQSTKMVNRRLKDGTTIKAQNNIASIRAQYAEKILKYKPDTKKASAKARKAKQEKEQKRRLSLFEEAENLL